MLIIRLGPYVILPNLNRHADVRLHNPPRGGPIEEHRDTVNLIIVLPLWEGEHLEDKAGQPLALHWQMNEANFDHG